ncbi:hypothetical protein LZ30DRAFT_748053 [Colletotrichum cereale]|nr:hypothetical protein LZ30DRAFT_748053 [Colletotrichum cereale]
MEPRPKRIKIDVACEACRRRKVKCDGARPACGNCWKRTDLRDGCTYSFEAAEKSFSRERSKNASPRSPAGVLPKVMHTPPDVSFTQPLMPPTTRADPPATVASTRSSGPDLARRNRLDRHPITPSDASPSVVDSMTTVREDGMATGEYFESQADYVLPTRKQADHLMGLYWYYVDPLYPFLDRQSFEHSYRALFAGTSTDVDERIFVSILNLIFALSTQLIESMTPEQRDSSSQVYFKRAQDLLQFSLWDTGSIELIQWSVVRIAQGLGLHLHETSLELSNESERNLVKRIWHGCLLMDRFLKMSESETTLDEVFRRQAVILRIRLLHARMLLLRPMLACFCLSQSPEPSQVHDDLSSRVVQQGAMVSVFSSLDISRSWNQAMGLLHDHESLGPSARRCAAALQILSTKMFQEQQPQSSTLPNSEANPAVPNIANDQQETFDMPFPYLTQDTAFDMDAISFDASDFSWLNSMPGSL